MRDWSGVDFRNLKAHPEWHTSSSKATPLNPSNPFKKIHSLWLGFQIDEPMGTFLFRTPQIALWFTNCCCSVHMKPGFNQANLLHSTLEAAASEKGTTGIWSPVTELEAALWGSWYPSFSLRKLMLLWLTHICSAKGLLEESLAQHNLPAWQPCFFFRQEARGSSSRSWTFSFPWKNHSGCCRTRQSLWTSQACQANYNLVPEWNMSFFLNCLASWA